MTVARGRWRGEESIALAAEWGEVVVLPGRGAKIASLADRAGREWLAQPDGDLPAVDHSVAFADAEMCGWDEMAPTVRTKGMADHGDVWRTPWSVLDARDDAIALEVRTDRFTLRRTLTAVRDGFVLDYAARSLEPGLPFLWMAHPQFRADGATRVRVAPVPRTAARDERGRLVETSWDDTAPALADVPRGAGRKLWFGVSETAPTELGVHHADGAALTMSWTGPITAAALWIDHCWRSREPVVCPEPATSPGDDVEAAAAAGSALELSADQWTEWTVAVKLGAGDPEEGGRS
ncbi:hypothetical protein [Agromyces sp. SYSU T0242]|uniref:hypothetical protein n=1 Tax=Agromyces litoreus TaxID=3158561 RepID=UPI0033987C7C